MSENWRAVRINPNPYDKHPNFGFLARDVSLEDALVLVYSYIRRADAHVIDQIVTYEDDNVFLGWNESVVACVYIKDSLGYVYDITRYL